MKKLFLALLTIALSAVTFGIAAPAHASANLAWTPAHADIKSIAAVVPSWCTDHVLGYRVPAVDGSGHVVRPEAVESNEYYIYSQSGASASLDVADYKAVDGHVYQISLHRWQKQGGTMFNGTTGHVDSSLKSWKTGQNLWLTVATPTPSYILAGYDINRPAVGFRVEILPCA